MVFIWVCPTLYRHLGCLNWLYVCVSFRTVSWRRWRGSALKRRLRCWRVSSTQTLCASMTSGSLRWRGRSASCWWQSSWRQARSKREERSAARLRPTLQSQSELLSRNSTFAAFMYSWSPDVIFSQAQVFMKRKLWNRSLKVFKPHSTHNSLKWYQLYHFMICDLWASI